MRRRTFLRAAISATIMQTSAFAGRVSGRGMGISNLLPSVAAAPPQSALKPMALGLMIQPATGAEAAIARVKELGMPTCFLSLDGYIGKFTNRWRRKYARCLKSMR